MVPRTNCWGSGAGLACGMGSVAWFTFFQPQIAFLWHNVIGAVVVLVVGTTVSALTGGSEARGA